MTFLSGALNLSSFTTLRVDGTLLGSTDPASYPVVPALPGYGVCRDGGFPTANAGVRHQALLSGWNLTGASVVGGGVIDGQGLVEDQRLQSSWVSRFRSNTLQYGRPRVFEPMFSVDVRLQGVSIRNQAFWAVHPYACDEVYVSRVSVVAPRDEGIPNDDGIDPDSCSNVLVEDCYVSVGDNSVAIKSGIDYAGRSFGHPSYNIVMRNSSFASETWAIGSEMSGGVFNVTVENCRFGGHGSDYAGIHLKTKRGRGSAIHSVSFRDIVIDSRNVTRRLPVLSASMFYSNDLPPTNATATPQIHDVSFENVAAYMHGEDGRSGKGGGENFALQFIGLAEQAMQRFAFTNVSVTGANDGWQCQHTEGFSFSGSVVPVPPADCKQ